MPAKALLIVDMLNDFIDKNGALYCGDTVLPKKRFSGFFRTGLEDVLESAGVEEVEIVGVCTSICVMDTVGGLVNRDYKVNVPIQGVADFDPEAHRFSLKRMEKIYGANVS